MTPASAFLCPASANFVDALGGLFGPGAYPVFSLFCTSPFLNRVLVSSLHFQCVLCDADTYSTLRGLRFVLCAVVLVGFPTCSERLLGWACSWGVFAQVPCIRTGLFSRATVASCLRGGCCGVPLRALSRLSLLLPISLSLEEQLSLMMIPLVPVSTPVHSCRLSAMVLRGLAMLSPAFLAPVVACAPMAP